MFIKPNKNIISKKIFTKKIFICEKKFNYNLTIKKKEKIIDLSCIFDQNSFSMYLLFPCPSLDFLNINSTLFPRTFAASFESYIP